MFGWLLYVRKPGISDWVSFFLGPLWHERQKKSHFLHIPLLFAKLYDTFDVAKYFFSTLRKLLMMSPPTWSPNLLEVIAKLFIWLRKYFCQFANSPNPLSVPCRKATAYHKDRLLYYFYHFISRSKGTWIL